MRVYILFIALVLSTTAQALYNGNPGLTESIEDGIFFSKDCNYSIKVGAQCDYVFDRKMKGKGEAEGQVDNFTILQNQGTLTFNMQDRVEAYGSAGSFHAEFANEPHSDHKRREYGTHDHFTWGAGLRAVVFHWGNALMGIDGKYQSAITPVMWNTLNGEALPPASRLECREWQVATSMAYEAGMFIPYAGLTYAHTYAKVNGIDPALLVPGSFKMTNRERFGLALGCTLAPGCIVDLSIEARFFSEQALTLAGDIKF